MTTIEVANKLVELCKAGKNEQCMKELYASDIVAIEAGAPPGQSTETKGIEGVMKKAQWWAENHTVHSATTEGPWPNGDKFIVRFTYDVTSKPMGNKRFKMDEAALYTVKNGKIVREEFFYTMG
jgi:ketosteroid isomerase-like protein